MKILKMRQTSKLPIRNGKHSIFYDGYDWVAITSEFKGLSGCSSTPRKALAELMLAIKLAKEVIKEDSI